VINFTYILLVTILYALTLLRLSGD